MRIMRTFCLAGTLPAAVLLTGCWGDCWCNSRNTKSPQPVVRQDPPVAKTPAQANNWSNPPAQAQTANAAPDNGSQITPGGYPAGTPVNPPLPTTPAAQQTTAAPPVDPTPGNSSSQIRIVNGTGSNSAGSTTIIPQQRDSTPTPPREIHLNDSTVTAPPPPDLPPPPATNAGSSTSKYSPAQPINPPLPPETLPGQGKIPALPPGPVRVD
jgi:hypothetical protein